MTSSQAPNPTLARLAAALSEDDARELVRTFLREFPGYRQQLASGDSKRCKIAAHSLKSSAQHMGAFALAERMAELELRLERRDASVTLEDLAGTDRDFEAAAGPLRAYSG